jgi:hypothetical protein
MRDSYRPAPSQRGYAPLVDVVALDELLAVVVVAVALLALLARPVLAVLEVLNSDVAAVVEAVVLPAPAVAIGNGCSMTST